VDVYSVRLHEPCDPLLNPQSIYLTQIVVTTSQIVVRLQKELVQMEGEKNNLSHDVEL
jgi:hypothetical protein